LHCASTMCRACPGGKGFRCVVERQIIQLFSPLMEILDATI
jgi:hypothetical protein